MSKKKYRIGRDEAEIAQLLRLNPDRWFTDQEVTAQLGGTPNNTLNRLGQLHVVDVLRTLPDHQFRWSAKAEQTNRPYIEKLKKAVDIYGLKPVPSEEPVVEQEPKPKPEYTGRRTRVVPHSRVVVTPEPEEPTPREVVWNINVPADDPRGPMNEGLGPDDDDPDAYDLDDLTAQQRKFVEEYAKKREMAQRRGKDGRFVKHNLVLHPEFGRGVVERQKGSKQIEVVFSRPHGKLVVFEKDLIADDRDTEVLKCVVCGNEFLRRTTHGRPSLYCTSTCKHRRNERVKAERAAAKAAEEADAARQAEFEARKSAAYIAQIANEPVPTPTPASVIEDVVAEVTTQPPTPDPAHTTVAIIVKHGDEVFSEHFTSVEKTVEWLMELI